MPEPPDPGATERPGLHGGPGESIAAQLWWYQDHRQPPPPAPPDRRRATRRERGRDALACLALATLCFSQAGSDVLLRGDWDFYNRARLGAPTLLALWVSIVALAAVGFLGVRLMRRARRPVSRRLIAVTAAASLLVSLNFVRITHETIGRWTDVAGRPALLALVVLILAASLAWPRPALRAIRGLALAVSPLAVVTLLQIVWMFLEVGAGPVFRHVDPEPLKQPAPSLRRVVWVVFEELDQRITFEARPAGLELPELDRLRRESLYADAARPPAAATEVSMPALITGRPVVAVAPTGPNDLELTFADGKTARWSGHANVFSRARTLGYDTALIGWHLPYPRILGGSLGVADWRPSIAYEQARGDTFVQALRNQWGTLRPSAHAARLYAQRVVELGDLAIRAATDSRFGLVLLHFPVPGGPAIYDRAAGRLTPPPVTGADAGHLDNLALTDRVIAELRRGIDRNHLGDRTWIVVSSNRWWRAAKRYDGQVDQRVPFLVRPPDGGRTVHVDAVFNTLATHDLVLGILRGSIHDTDDAAAWLSHRPVTPPRSYTSEGRPIY